MHYAILWVATWIGYSQLAVAASIPNSVDDNDVDSSVLSKVPYTEGLTLGQGYNTYLQQGCMNGAVDVKGDASPSPQVQITYQADQITEYSKIAQELDISASLGISYLDSSAEVQSKFLNKATFEESHLTYIVRADVLRQPNSQHKYEFEWNKAKDPGTRYCDRFISVSGLDFIQGGALYARVSIKTKDSSKNQDLEVNAKTAFGMFGVDVTVDAAMKKSSDFLHENSEIIVSWFWVGAPPDYGEHLKAVKEVDGNLLEIKNLSDKFIKEAGKHQWKRYAILERYDQIFNWNNEFQPLDYTEASERTWGVFNDYASYESMLQMVLKLELPEALEEQRKKLQEKVIQTKAAINDVTANPDASKQNPEYEAPENFFGTILDTLSTPFIVQKVDYQYVQKWSSSLIDQELRKDQANATRLFEIGAFTFPGITGTVKLTFGNRPKLPWWDKTIDAPLPPEYVEQSHLWVFNQSQAGDFNRPVYIFEVIDSEHDWWDRLEISLNSSPPDQHVRGPDIFYTKLVQGQELDAGSERDEDNEIT
ncbi:hypothetical protein CDD83_8271 [Cordyceps sp. RAO-2017]|nr:hypothetical protein CDD83_8271 [Cordyceps sp. RAO-2017]